MRVTVTATGTVHLLSALPTIGPGTTITGPGRTQFTVSGEDNFQVINVSGGRPSSSGARPAANSAGGTCSGRGSRP